MFVSFIDDYTQYASVYTIDKKSDVKKMFENFVKEIKFYFGEKYKFGVLRCDNGTEYINKELKEFCEAEGMLEPEPCPPYTSQNFCNPLTPSILVFQCLTAV